MTKLLQRAFDEASKLPENEQDALGRILLEELASERRWEELFAGSHDLLEHIQFSRRTRATQLFVSSLSILHGRFTLFGGHGRCP
jgi:hypothetical protein